MIEEEYFNAWGFFIHGRYVLDVLCKRAHQIVFIARRSKLYAG